MTAPTTQDLQSQTLATYLLLAAWTTGWPGRLVLVEAAPAAIPVALAASIAGAAILWIDPDAAGLREASQQGILDFSVTTLSEAIRILKNQVRTGEPVIVGLADPARTAWPEAVHRGLQPDAIFGAESATVETLAVETLVGRGARRLVPAITNACQIAPAASWRERRAGDHCLLAAAAALPPEEQGTAARWYAGAARLFPRDLHRCVATHWPASDTTV